MGDEIKALSSYQEAYSIYPHDMDTLCWIAAFYVRNEMYEKALEYFEQAEQRQPFEIKWSLMVASCYRSKLLPVRQDEWILDERDGWMKLFKAI